MNRVEIADRRVVKRVPKKWYRKRAFWIMEHFSLHGKELSLLLCGDEEIRSLNDSFRGFDCPTDVLAFNVDETPGEGEEVSLLGDLAISEERALEQAREMGYSIKRELTLLLSHGILHLLGYEHEESEMKKLEEQILSEVED